MSTYAKHRVWAGIARDRHGEWRIESDWPPFLSAVEQSGSDGVERDGLRFTEVYMHGGLVGIGVVIAELSWTTEIGKENVLDPSLYERARDVLERVQRVFAEERIRAVVKLYHHIDLGG